MWEHTKMCQINVFSCMWKWVWHTFKSRNFIILRHIVLVKLQNIHKTTYDYFSCPGKQTFYKTPQLMLMPWIFWHLNSTNIRPTNLNKCSISWITKFEFKQTNKTDEKKNKSHPFHNKDYFHLHTLITQAHSKDKDKCLEKKYWLNMCWWLKGKTKKKHISNVWKVTCDVSKNIFWISLISNSFMNLIAKMKFLMKFIYLIIIKSH